MTELLRPLVESPVLYGSLVVLAISNVFFAYWACKLHDRAMFLEWSRDTADKRKLYWRDEFLSAQRDLEDARRRIESLGEKASLAEDAEVRARACAEAAKTAREKGARLQRLLDGARDDLASQNCRSCGRSKAA